MNTVQLPVLTINEIIQYLSLYFALFIFKSKREPQIFDGFLTNIPNPPHHFWAVDAPQQLVKRLVVADVCAAALGVSVSRVHSSGHLGCRPLSHRAHPCAEWPNVKEDEFEEPCTFFVHLLPTIVKTRPSGEFGGYTNTYTSCTCTCT